MKTTKKIALASAFLAVMIFISSCVTININKPTDTTGEAVTTKAAETTAETEAETTAETEAETTEAETTAAETMTADQFIEAYGGYWSNSENWDFIYFGKNDSGECRATFAIWNAGGPFPSGTVKAVRITGEKSYILEISIDEVKENDENGGWAAYDVELPVTDVSGDAGRMISAVYIGETSARTFIYHKEAGNPFIGEN